MSGDDQAADDVRTGMAGAGEAGEVARAFGLGDGARFTGRVERGELGQVRELVTSRGAFAVKTSFEQAYLDSEDCAFQAAARAAGVPTPAVVCTTAGAWHAVVGGRPVRVCEWVDLLPADDLVDPAEVGSIVAAIHRTRFAGTRPQDPWYTDPVGAAAWDEVVAAVTAAAAPFAGDMAAMRDDLVALEAELRPPSELGTCHRDLWSDNLRPARAGGLCVIDWDNCGLAGPAQELAGVVFGFGAGDPARAGAVHRAYRAAGGPATVRARADFSMTIAQLGHITERACRLWLDPDVDGENRLRQEARVAEAAHQPLTLAVVDELLEAIASAG